MGQHDVHLRQVQGHRKSPPGGSASRGRPVGFVVDYRGDPFRTSAEPPQEGRQQLPFYFVFPAVITDIQHRVSLRRAACGFDTFACRRVIATVAALAESSHVTVISFFVVRTVKI